ncbi:hypothetical protein B4092_4706 [Bacillus licheniformis]|nr:hypothetical protein [Bacillus licheniformis]KYC77731.1 hypothetical protein B4092_4706 [Bacillus licheniformis]
MKVKWLVHTFVTVFITMVFMWIIKKVSTRYEIPVVSKIAKEV